MRDRMSLPSSSTATFKWYREPSFTPNRQTSDPSSFVSNRQIMTNKHVFSNNRFVGLCAVVHLSFPASRPFTVLCHRPHLQKVTIPVVHSADLESAAEPAVSWRTSPAAVHEATFRTSASVCTGESIRTHAATANANAVDAGSNTSRSV